MKTFTITNSFLFATLFALLACQTTNAQDWTPGELIRISGDDPTYRIYYRHIQPDEFQTIQRLEAAAQKGDWSARVYLNDVVPGLIRQYPPTDVTILGVAVPSDAYRLLQHWQRQRSLPGGQIYLYLKDGQLMFHSVKPLVYDVQNYYGSTATGDATGTYTPPNSMSRQDRIKNIPDFNLDLDLATPGYRQGSWGQ